jgi:hypothetical protein
MLACDCCAAPASTTSTEVLYPGDVFFEVRSPYKEYVSFYNTLNCDQPANLLFLSAVFDEHPVANWKLPERSFSANGTRSGKGQRAHTQARQSRMFGF